MTTTNHNDDSQDIGVVLDLFAPAGAHRDYEFVLQNNNATISLRGGVVQDFGVLGMALWKGSELLAKYLMQHSEMIQSKSVLELGAGLGLCGIVAHHMGAASVLVTDGVPEVVEYLEYNVQHNQIHNTILKADILQWDRNLDAFPQQYDCILAADCVYTSTNTQPLWNTIAKLLKPDGFCIYVNECSSQDSFDQVLEVACHVHGFVQGESHHDGVHLFRREVMTKPRDEYP
jgi:2-polyprenyl-3-methyl-5-hydroxy-6-metoxy-1,4-benzoquinol methylase